MRRQARLTSRVIGSILFCSLLPTDAAKAQDEAALAARLHAAADANAIDGAGMSPWHLRMDVQLFDAKGKPGEQGKIEEWWGGPDARRVTFAFPSFGGTQLRNREGSFATKDGVYESGVLDDLLEQVVHPMPRDKEIDHATPELRKQKFGKVELECLWLAQPLKNVFVPVGLFPTFCFDPGTNALRITTEAGALMFSHNRMEDFQGRSVAMDLTGRSPDGVRATAQVTTLESWTPVDGDFTTAAGMIPIAVNPVELSQQMVGRALTTVSPMVPVGAMGTSGTMVFHAILGRDGRIHSLHLVSTPDASVAMSYAQAMRLWTYKPVVLNGVPTEVDTMIHMNYSFNPSPY
jgi:hypothetical protein